MKVKLVELTNLFNHEATTLELPEVGVTVVTGANGAGKSSIVEAASVVGWNKTLRGAPPWHTAEGRSGVKLVTHDGLTIYRYKTEKSYVRLEWELEGSAEKKFTRQEGGAQQALELELGSYDVWRRSRVFSSGDAGHFSSATDRARKEFLEAALDLNIFDEPLARCRDDLKKAKHEADSAKQALSLRELELAETKRRLESAKSNLNDLQLPPRLRATRAVTPRGSVRT